MQVPTILKGDDSGPIVLVMDEAHDYTGATLVVAYSGVTRKFTNLTPGGSVSLSFTHEETSRFNLGCKPVLMRLIGPSGAVETVENAALKIKVTDCLGEVNAGGSFVIKPGTQAGSVPVTDLGDIPTTANVSALYAKVNEIIRVLAQRSLLAFAVCLTTIAFATVQTTTLGNINPSSVVVTNVTESPGSVISDGTNAIDAAGNTYTNGVVSGRLRARDDRVWGERTFTPWQFDILTEIAPAFEGATVTVSYHPDEYTAQLDGLNPPWEGESYNVQDAYQTNLTFLVSNYSTAVQRNIEASRTETTDMLALKSELGQSGGGGIDTNTVAEIANHAIATNATVSGLTSQVSSLSSSKRDIDDNHFYGNFELYDGDITIFSPFGIYAHFLNVRGHNTFDEGWSNITVSANGSRETMPEYLDRNISTNNPAFVSAVRATPPDPETPWGTYGTLGAAIAGIIAMLANKLTKGLDAQGIPTDPNVAELFSESNTFLKGVIAAKTGTTSAEKTGNNIQLDDGGVVVATSAAPVITFGTAKQADKLRFCELYLTVPTGGGAIASVDGAIYSEISDVLTLEAGTYYFAFAEFEVVNNVSHWKVSRNKVDLINQGA